jgi:hypothetical protein
MKQYQLGGGLNLLTDDLMRTTGVNLQSRYMKVKENLELSTFADSPAKETGLLDPH